MTERRNTVRMKTPARVTVKGFEKEKTSLKDISVTGCCVVCSPNTQIDLKTQYSLKISPESSAEIGAFNVTAESRWIKTSANSFEIGFMLLESPQGEQFLRYVDYLSWRYSHGHSIAGD